MPWAAASLAYLPADNPRCQFPTAQALLVLVRNALMSRESGYAVGTWAARFAPDLFNLWDEQLALRSTTIAWDVV